jgi:hypothetical protein
MKKLVLLTIVTVLIVFVALSCQNLLEQKDSNEYLTSQSSKTINDAVHNGGNKNFFFLPPMVPISSYSGVFDGSLSPVVEISPSVAVFTMTTGPGSETVRVVPEEEHYIVNWHTKDFLLDPAITYRITVLINGKKIGYADVDVVNKGNKPKNVDAGEYIALEDGETLPIKFRIERESPITYSWKLATAAAPWSGRNAHASVVFDGKMWVLAGRSSPAPDDKNDVWWSTDGANWTMATASAPWSPRTVPTCIAYDNRMWIMGGYSGGSYFNDVWSSTDGANWTQATAAAPWGARYMHTSVVHDGKMWVMSGARPGADWNDVWSSTDGISWTPETSDSAWIPRAGASSVAHDGRIWILAGSGNGSLHNDVWSSADGATWTPATLSAPWSPRWAQSSVSFNQRIWVLGGSESTYKNDVWWSTDGVNWTLDISSTLWSARGFHCSVVYDNKIWVLGGHDGTYKNDVWYYGQD